MKTKIATGIKLFWKGPSSTNKQFALLSHSLALIFFWFDLVKPMGLSLGQGLIACTVFWFSPKWFIRFLGWWEMAEGILFLFPEMNLDKFILLLIQLPETLPRIILQPEIVLTQFLYGLSLDGQFIMKNLILAAAELIIRSIGNAILHVTNLGRS